MDWLAWICAAGAAFGWLWERRERRIEERAKQKAEEELHLIKRRGEAPLLVVSKARFNLLYVPEEKDGQIGFVKPNGTRLLCYNREQVPEDLEANTPVYLVVENVNQGAPRVSVTLDGEPIVLALEPHEDGDRKRLHYLLYRYDPQKRDKDQVLQLWFEAHSGFQDTHRYRMIHGRRFLERVDPS